MSVKENKALYRRFVDEVWNKRNVEAADEFIAADLIEHNGLTRYDPTREGFK